MLSKPASDNKQIIRDIWFDSSSLEMKPVIKVTPRILSKLSWISVIGPKVSKDLKRKDAKLFSESSLIWKVFSENCFFFYLKPLPNSYPDLYQVDCNYERRSTEHQDDSVAGKWESSGTLKTRNHVMNCLLPPMTLAKLKTLRKRKNTRIFRNKQAWSEVKSDDTIKVLNRDRGNIVNKTSWRPLLRKIDLIT